MVLLQCIPDVWCEDYEPVFSNSSKYYLMYFCDLGPEYETIEFSRRFEFFTIGDTRQPRNVASSVLDGDIHISGEQSEMEARFSPPLACMRRAKTSRFFEF